MYLVSFLSLSGNLMSINEGVALDPLYAMIIVSIEQDSIVGENPIPELKRIIEYLVSDAHKLIYWRCEVRIVFLISYPR